MDGIPTTVRLPSRRSFALLQSQYTILSRSETPDLMNAITYNNGAIQIDEFMFASSGYGRVEVANSQART